MKKILVLIAIFAIFSSFSLKAETTSSWYNKFYVGTGVGFLNGFEDTFTQYATYKGKNNIDIFLGYKLHKYFNIEIGYQHFLNKELLDPDNETFTPYYSGTLSYTGYNYYINGILKYQINKHIPFFIFGVSQTAINTYTHFRFTDSNRNYDLDTAKHKGITYTLGLGYEYLVFKNNSLGFKVTYNIIYKPETKRQLGMISRFEYNSDNINYENLTFYYKYNI